MEKQVTQDSVGAMFLGEEAEAPEQADMLDEPVEAAQEPLEDDQPEEVVEEGVEEEVTAEAEEQPESDDEELEFIDVEYDGKLYQVPPELKEALLRQQDYTQKTQEVSAQRKQIEAITEAVNQQKAQYEFTQQVFPDVIKAQQLDAQVKEYKEYLRSNVDSLQYSDMEKIRMAIETASEERDSLMNTIQGKQTEFQQAQQQSFQELLNKGTEVLRQKIPGWGEESQKAVRQYALNAGYTEQEISGVADPRQVETLWKASQYDALQEGKGSAVRKVQSAPQIKPKSRNPMPKETQDRLNLRKKVKSNNLSAKQKQDLVAQDLAQRWT